MKISNKKIIVSTLALAMGAALAGSISGSVAWYQYSTRAAAQFVGTSAGTIGDLQVKLGATGTYGHLAQTTGTPAKFLPISASVNSTSKAVENYYPHPVYQAPNTPAYTADELADAETKNYYHDYNLYFKFSESDGTTTSYEAKNVYLTYFAIEKADGSTLDVSDAVRVEIRGTNQFLFSKSETAETVDTTGTLDVGGAEGKIDTNYWDCQDIGGRTGESNVTYINGASGSTSASYTTRAHADGKVTVTDPYDLDTDNTAKILTVTKADGSDSVAVTVRIWIEGWALLDDDGDGEHAASASWGETLINQDFNVNMQFACSANK